MTATRIMEQNYHGRGKSERAARCSAPGCPGTANPGHPLTQPEGR